PTWSRRSWPAAAPARSVTVRSGWSPSSRSSASAPVRWELTLSEARAAGPMTPADGGGPARRRAAAIDAALADMAGAASAALAGTAVVAVGGYGRGELSPHSDIDLLLVHGGRAGQERDQAVRALLYPL